MKIAIAGLGFMGSTHAQSLLEVPDVQLAGLVSSDPLKLSGDLSGVRGNLDTATGKLDFSHVGKYNDLDALLANAEIDAVDICLPTDQHFSAALAALRAGKHVLVEKPLALDGRAANQLIREAEKAGVILMVGHVLRFIPEYVKLAEILKSHTLGAVHAAFFRRRCGAPAWSRWQTDPSRSGGAVLDLIIHDIDFCLHLFGKPHSVSAVGFVDLSRGIDWLEARLNFEKIGPVIVTGGWHHPKSYPFSMEFTVVSSGGTMEFRSGEGGLNLFDASGNFEPVAVPPQNPFVEELRYFAECVRTGRQPERCPPVESAQAVKLAQMLAESRERKGDEVVCHF